MSNDPSNKKQEDIEKLLQQFKSSDDEASGDASSETPTDSGAAETGESGGGESLSPDEIQAMLDQNQKEGAEGSPAAAQTQTGAESVPQPVEGSSAGNDINYLMSQTKQALESIDSPSLPQLEGLAEFKLEEFPGSPPSTEHATLDLLRDVELDLKIELGRTQMYLDEVLRLKRGSVVPLDKLAGDPVDVYVNGRLVARGEVLVLNDNFCVRVAELISGNDVD